MTAEIRIGTSGWNYRDWRQRFYPLGLPVARWFQHYAQVFNTVEINNTFYRLVSPETFDAWQQQAPAGFVYAVKCNRYLTHNLKLTNAAEPLERFFSRARRLGATLGPVLYQLPPRWKRNVARLQEFFAQLPSDVTHVMEFREADWLSEDVYQVLEQHRICLCVHDLLPDHPRRLTGPVAYVRFHGSQGKYQGTYSDEQLRGWAKWIQSTAAKGTRVYAYFNNDPQAHAVHDAIRLRAMVEKLQ